MQVKKFKIRASAIGKIMAGQIGLTEKQHERLDYLNGKESLTDNQSKDLTQLKHKKNNPILPETIKTYCKDWLKGQILNRQKTLNNKYVDKGNIMEDESIDFISEQLDYGMLIKNEHFFYNEYIQGTPDLLPDKETVIDAKNSWSHETFPLFETKATTNDYYWQLQGYMDLTERTKAKLCYVLSNTPEHLIEREARNYCLRNGYEELETGVYQEFHDRMNYDDIEDKFKIKTFEYDLDKEAVKQIYERVRLCRKYIDELIETL